MPSQVLAFFLHKCPCDFTAFLPGFRVRRIIDVFLLLVERVEIMQSYTVILGLRSDIFYRLLTIEICIDF